MMTFSRSRPALFALACLLVLSTEVASAAEAPNILLCVADDLGYGDLGCCGAEDLRTPHLDTLFSQGMQFTEFYANCPVCSPTRAAVLTGRYQDMVGVPGVIRTHADNNWGYLTHEAVLLPQLLRQARYDTRIIGKWHLGLESPNTPTERGFHHFQGFLGDMMDDYYTHLRHDINYMRFDTEEVHPEGHATDLFSTWAAEYIQGRKDQEQPFFLYLAYNAPHTPIQPPADWLEKVRQRAPDMPLRRAKLVALIEHMDAGFGQVLAALDDAGLADNTLVLFTSDNGGQLDVGANNGPLRDGKQSVYEGGIKVPFAARLPGQIQPGTTSTFRAMSMDLFPTLLELAGVDCPHAIDGCSIWPTLSGHEQQELREFWFFRRREGGLRYGGKTIEAVRWGDWKLLQNDPFGPQELYNLHDDPLEQHDLSKQNRQVFQKLAAVQRAEIQRYGSVPWQKPVVASESAK
ncbi:MAG: sulfatase-like hydrolase/transferase [Planctomycetaceae bacterium]|nr:sulfatase-like hydrolase/transferase [Planctomycetaceae bacterium]